MIKSKNRYCFMLGQVYAIPARGWDRNDKKMHICIGLILELMFYLWRDLHPIPFSQNHIMAFKDHCPFPFEDIKELTRAVVIMNHFRAASRNAFLDHAHIVAFEQMPAFGNLAPDIVFSVFNRNYHTCQG